MSANTLRRSISPGKLKPFKLLLLKAAIISLVSNCCLPVTLVNCQKESEPVSQKSGVKSDSQFQNTEFELRPLNYYHNLTSNNVSDIVLKPEGGGTANHGENVYNTNDKNQCSAQPTISVTHKHKVQNSEQLGSGEDPKDTSFVSLAQEDDGKVLKIENYGRILLTCTAREPVTWTFEGLMLPEAIRSVKIKRDFANPENPSTFCYKSSITVSIPRPPRYPGLGLYICSKASNTSERLKSVYLYGAANLPDLLVSPNGKNVLVETPSFTSEDIKVPCRGNNPNITVHLTKRSKTQNEYNEIDREKYSVSFSPRDGFTIIENPEYVSNNSVSKNDSVNLDPKSDLYGYYKCKTIGKVRDDILEVLVKPGGARPKRSDKIEIIVQEYEAVGLLLPCKRFVCMYNTSTKGVDRSEKDADVKINSSELQMSIIRCANPIQCHLLLGYLNDGLKSPFGFENVNSQSACGHTDDIMSLNADIINSVDFRPRNEGSGVVVCRTKDWKKYQFVEYFRSVAVESIAGQILLKPDTHDLNFGSGSHPVDTLEDIKSSVVNIIGPNSTIYVKEQIEISCDISSFLFANGSKLLVEYSNGSLANPHYISSSQLLNLELARVEITAVVNITSTDIVSFVCLAPVWNCDAWINQTVPVNVLDGTSPTIVAKTDELVVYYDTDVNKTLLCEAVGFPIPKVTWYQNGEPFESDTQNIEVKNIHDENSNKSLLHFHRAFYNAMSIAGIYTCNATNVEGTKLHHVTVQVEKYSAMIYWLPVVGIFLLTCLIVLAFFSHKFWKKSETQKRYINQLTKQEIQQFKYGRHSVKLPQQDENDIFSSGFCNFTNVGFGIEQALDLPYDEAQFEVSEKDLVVEDSPKVLGSGNFGIVVQGCLFQNNSKVDVAVKMLKTWDVTEAKILLSELKILTYVGKHENVVSLLGAITNIKQFRVFEMSLTSSSQFEVSFLKVEIPKTMLSPNAHIYGKILLLRRRCGLYELLKKLRYKVIIEYCAEGSLEKFLRGKRNFFVDQNENNQVQYTQVLFNDGTTANYVKADFGICTFDLIRWAHQFACGMVYLASRKIIHGDLAVRNLLLTDKRDLKITDFGLSKKLRNNQPNYIPTSKSLKTEQPWRSQALECWFDNKQLSTESDVWAFGITLWEIFSLAQVPYHTEFPEYRIEFPSQLAAGLRMKSPPYATSNIYNLMLNCWDANPHSRPSFPALAAEFERLLPGNYVKSLYDQGKLQSENQEQMEVVLDNMNNQNDPSSPENNEMIPISQKNPPACAHNLGYVYSDQLEQFQIEHGA